MRGGLSDTSPDVLRRMYEAYRRMPPWRKVAQVGQSRLQARHMHAAGYRHHRPGATDAEVNRAWVLTALGPGPWVDRMEFAAMNPTNEQHGTLKFVIAVLDDLNIRYALGGSYASSTHGVPRYTQDADVMVEPFPYKEKLFAMRFPAGEYYADEQMIRDAVSRRSSFNILHLPTAFKIDVFVRKDRAFEREVLARRIKAPVFGPDEAEVGVISAEDTVLLKLEWYRLGGETSDRQWNDVVGVLRTRAGELDEAYLDHWAAALGVKDLLDEARIEG